MQVALKAVADSDIDPRMARGRDPDGYPGTKARMVVRLPAPPGTSSDAPDGTSDDLVSPGAVRAATPSGSPVAADRDLFARPLTEISTSRRARVRLATWLAIGLAVPVTLLVAISLLPRSAVSRPKPPPRANPGALSLGSSTFRQLSTSATLVMRSEESSDTRNAAKQRAAAQAYIAGRAQEALSRYRQLATEEGDRQMFFGFVKVIEERIARMCREGSATAGIECPPR